VQYNDALHGLTTARGTGTAVLELKLCMALAGVQQRPFHVAFLDIEKAFDSFHRDRLLDIATAYGLGPISRRIISSFWDMQQLATRQSGFYGEVFTAHRGVTQGCCISSEFCKLATDCVIRAWLNTTIDDDGRTVRDGLGDTVQDRLVSLYSDDHALASSDAPWLQEALTCLTDLLARIGLRVNNSKSVVMSCHPGFIHTGISTEAYNRRVTGEGPTFRDRQRAHVTCPDCGIRITRASLLRHLQSQHQRNPDTFAPPLPDFLPTHVPRHYRVDWPRIETHKPCPTGCPYQAITPTGLRRHFRSRHPRDFIHVTREGEPFPKCPLCLIQARYALDLRHHRSRDCQTHAARRQQRDRFIHAYLEAQTTFTLHDTVLEKVTSYRYLGRVLATNDNEWPTIYRNLQRARQQWARISRLMRTEHVEKKAAGMFYKAIVQSVLLYCCETWVIDERMLQTLSAFHHRVSRHITKCHPTLRDGIWHYPAVDSTLDAAGLYHLSHCIQVRRDSIAAHISTRPIYQQCITAQPASGAPSRLQWWTQRVYDIDDSEYTPSSGSGSSTHLSAQVSTSADDDSLAASQSSTTTSENEAGIAIAPQASDSSSSSSSNVLPVPPRIVLPPDSPPSSDTLSPNAGGSPASGSSFCVATPDPQDRAFQDSE